MLFRQQSNVFPQRSFVSAFLCEAFRFLVWCKRSIAIAMLYWKAWDTNASWIWWLCRWTCTRLHLFGMEFSLQVPLVENYRSHPHQNRSHYHRCVWYICFLCCYCLLMYKCCAFSFFVVRVPFWWQFQLRLLETAIDLYEKLEIENKRKKNISLTNENKTMADCVTWWRRSIQFFK